MLGYNLTRRLWELPGGHIEPGEAPWAAAASELEEETGYVVADLEFTGYARFSLDFGRRLETAAVFRGTAAPEGADAFVPNAEIGALRSWDGVEALNGRIQPLEPAIGRFALQHHVRALDHRLTICDLGRDLGQFVERVAEVEVQGLPRRGQ